VLAQDLGQELDHHTEVFGSSSALHAQYALEDLANDDAALSDARTDRGIRGEVPRLGLLGPRTGAGAPFRSLRPPPPLPPPALLLTPSGVV
jgi:hypothetical protein